MSEATLETPATAKPKKKYLFQVLAGTHWEKGEVENDLGHKVIKDIAYGPGRPAGDIVESDIDLAKRFNSANPAHPPRFRRLGEDGQRDARAEELKVERQRSAGAQSALASALRKMSRQQLVQWAEEQEIDLRGANRHEEVLQVVLASLDS